MNRRAPLAILALLALGACATPTASEPEASASIAATETAEPSVQVSVAPSEAEPSPSESEASTRRFGLTVPFSMLASSAWTRDETSTQAQLILTAGPERWIVFSTLGQDTVDGWMTSLTNNAALTVVAEPEPVEIGGASGFVVDVEASAEADNTGCGPYPRCVVLFDDEAGPWLIIEGFITRAWVVDVDGEPVIIVTEAAPGSIESWGQTVSEALETVTWNP